MSCEPTLGNWIDSSKLNLYHSKDTQIQSHYPERKILEGSLLALITEARKRCKNELWDLQLKEVSWKLELIDWNNYLYCPECKTQTKTSYYYEGRYCPNCKKKMKNEVVPNVQVECIAMDD